MPHRSTPKYLIVNQSHPGALWSVNVLSSPVVEQGYSLDVSIALFGRGERQSMGGVVSCAVATFNHLILRLQFWRSLKYLRIISREDGMFENSLSGGISKTK